MFLIKQIVGGMFVAPKIERESNMNSMSEPVEGEGVACADVRDMLYLYVCEELEDHEMVEIAGHLAKCESCRSAMAETIVVAGALSDSLPRVPQHYYSRNN